MSWKPTKSLKKCPWCGMQPVIGVMNTYLHIHCANPDCQMQPDTWNSKVGFDGSLKQHWNTWNGESTKLLKRKK